ncbi:hypothetical protein Hanom_Chr10g00915521 [Helianthus anomalus]
MNPFGLAKVCHFELACRGLGSDPDLDVFRAFYKLNRSGSWYTFEVRKKNACCYTWITISLKDWKDSFFLIDDRCVPTTLIKEAGRIRKYPEHILVMGRISTIWAEPEWYPTLKWNGESFDSTEFDVRATRTPKGDPPYLSVVQENLYPIREPTAPITQGGSAGQGGSGSVPSIWTSNVVPVQATAVVGDKGKRSESVSAKGGSGSKFVTYGSEHLSVEDEEVHAQVSLKRRRNNSKPDPNLKILKKKKLDFHTITLDDDEVDQVTSFSTAGGLLENLNAHLHSGRTPRDRPVTLPTSPFSFGGPATKVIEDIHMPEPLSFKKIELSPSGKPTTGVASNVSRPSPQPIDGRDSASSSPLWYETEAVFLLWELGSGDALDMDSARASEKYIPEWSLANKDRIVDALSAKMAWFHLGTQSNSLVVETYKRWVESESNCRKFEREIANLKNVDNVRSKAKQELSSLRSQVDRLKEQVSEAKEVNKSSQASAAAAYEARDKALQDLEAFKLKFGDLEKKLSDAEKRSKAELKEMQTSYDQLLADHHRLISKTLIFSSLIFLFLR